MRISFEGDTIVEVITQMAVFLQSQGLRVENDITDSGDEPEEEIKEAAKPKAKPKAKKAEPEPAPEPEPENTEDAKADKAEALNILMAAYTDKPDSREKIRDILEAYGVKKFGDVPDEAGTQLLAKAKELVA